MYVVCRVQYKSTSTSKIQQSVRPVHCTPRCSCTLLLLQGRKEGRKEGRLHRLSSPLFLPPPPQTPKDRLPCPFPPLLLLPHSPIPAYLHASRSPFLPLPSSERFPSSLPYPSSSLPPCTAARLDRFLLLPAPLSSSSFAASCAGFSNQDSHPVDKTNWRRVAEEECHSYSADMGSRGNSIGERDSGTDSNEADCGGNFMQGTEAESNGVRIANLYTDLQQNMATGKGDRAMSADTWEQHTSLDGSVIQHFSFAGGVTNTVTGTNLDVRDRKPWLEPEKSSSKLSSPTTHITEMYPSNMMDQERRMAGSACLTMSLGPFPTKASDRNVGNGHSVYNLPGMFESPFDLNAHERNQFKAPPPNQTHTKPRQLLPKQYPLHELQDVAKQCQPPSNRPEPFKEASPQVSIRVARPPPIEGRGRNQLLPRYWPRITDQELQQITARDSNSTITPLFEKMLSASDAGRIGRLVLPKACAEAYFPSISQPEGVPLKIQDVSGKDWVFQFRFWPNNNSRMYVLEGVTPCIQSMQLQAGDTVTFSRLDPEGKLVMGYRRAPSSLSSQETTGPQVVPPTSVANGGSLDSFPNITSLAGYLPQSAKNSEVWNDGHLNVSDTGYGWYKADKSGQKAKDDSFFQPLLPGDKKKLKPAPSKCKRPTCMDESIEFRITWEEAQDLLRSPPNGSPNIVSIEGYDFEEYEEPPVFGKRTLFTSSNLGAGEDQWAQCDDCGNWRKVPADVFLPTRWVCIDNVWDLERNFCNAPQEVSNEEIESLIQHFKDTKKQELAEPLKANESLSNLEALANAATAGENSPVASPAATTKHPRHRPGCTCIVCIQPPSGKGPKHKPTCICNVCMTVKRRFKTLMMRRKKRQSEREAENAARKKRLLTKEDGGDASNGGKWKNDSYPSPEGFLQGNLVVPFPNALSKVPNFAANTNGYRFPSNVSFQVPYASRAINFADDFKGHIDLNIQPDREEEMNRNAFRVSMMRLLQNASHPLDSYLKEQGLSSLISAQLLHPQMNFRSPVEWDADRHNVNQPMVALSSERAQEGLYMTLGISRFGTTGSLPHSCT